MKPNTAPCGVGLAAYPWVAKHPRLAPTGAALVGVLFLAHGVIALLGDGSAMYSIQALFSISRAALPISVIVIANRRYEALEQFGRHFGLDRVEGTDLSGLDFCAIGRGHGVPSRRAATPDELDAALVWSFAESGPTLVEIVLP